MRTASAAAWELDSSSAARRIAKTLHILADVVAIVVGQLFAGMDRPKCADESPGQITRDAAVGLAGMVNVLGRMFNVVCIDENVIVGLQDVAAVIWRLATVPLNRRLSINQLTGVFENQSLRFKEGCCEGSLAMNGGVPYFNEYFG
jgi:hypothetical protein